MSLIEGKAKNLGQFENQLLIIFHLLPYFFLVGRFHGDGPRFWDFQSSWVPFVWLTSILLTPSFCKKNQFSLYHI